MSDIVKLKNNEIEAVEGNNGLIELSEGMLAEARASINNSSNTLSVPIAELSTLGAGVSSLIPALNTVTQTTTIATEGLYQLANAGIGDILKIAKNGNFWGAFKTADGVSKFAQLQAAGPLSATTTTAAALNPATMMMAVALFSIERGLGKIVDMEKQIISFLEIEKESEIKADLETLISLVTRYKLNWDNEHFVASNHMVSIIKRDARKNMEVYRKKVETVLNNSKQFRPITQSKVKSTSSDLQKNFQYYRLCLYNFSLASMMEVLLSENFKEDNITKIRDEIRGMSDKYRELFSDCSIRLEKMGNAAVKVKLERIGVAGKKKVGKLIRKIPFLKEGLVDELQGSGEHLKKNAVSMEMQAVKEFAPMGNPGTNVFIEKMENMIQIYNRTSQICFDNEKIYLIANKGAKY